MDELPRRSTLRSWFAFGLRLLGFWEVLTAAGYFLTGLNVSVGFTKSVTGSWSFASFMTQTFGHPFLRFGFWPPHRKSRSLFIRSRLGKTVILQKHLLRIRRPSNQSL